MTKHKKYLLQDRCVLLSQYHVQYANVLMTEDTMESVASVII